MRACVPLARCRDREWNDGGTERWSEVGSTESRPTICLRIDFLVGRRSAEYSSAAFSPLQYSNTPCLSGALRFCGQVVNSIHVAQARFYFGRSNNRSLHFT